VWWALGCLKMAAQWRSGADRMLERVVISRRTSEQELDLLLLLEEDAPEVERARPLKLGKPVEPSLGEATTGELVTAVSEWLATLKDKLAGHDCFQLAVARNALGMVARDEVIWPYYSNWKVEEVFSGQTSLATPNCLAELRVEVLEKVMVDSPKYPALAHARTKWTGEE